MFTEPQEALPAPSEARDVYQCSGCGGRSVRCRACARAHARRGTPNHLRAETASPIWKSTHDPDVLPDDPEGVVSLCDEPVAFVLPQSLNHNDGSLSFPILFFTMMIVVIFSMFTAMVLLSTAPACPAGVLYD